MSADPMLTDVAVVIPARNEAAQVALTVTAAASIPGVGLVIVVSDGSEDETAALARAAGAVVVTHRRTLGKGAAMETGALAADAVEQREGRRSPRHLLFLDADLGVTASAAAALVTPIRERKADMTIARLPHVIPGGGHGFVVHLSRSGVRRLTGWEPSQPLSGQRCLTREAFEAARPLASGFGVETGLTIDLLRAGFRVLEVDASLRHRVTGADWRGQRHRGRQFLHVGRALTTRLVPRSPGRHVLAAVFPHRFPAPGAPTRRCS